MLYLSLLELDPRCRQVQAELRSPYEMHRTLSKAFEDTEAAQATARCLFRVDEDRQNLVRLLVQSQTAPDWDRLTVSPGYLHTPPQLKPFQPNLQLGQVLAFRLRANPTKRLAAKREGKTQGDRIGLYTDEERHDWLARQAAAHGFRLETVTVTGEEQAACPTKGRTAVFSAARFEGVLRVLDPENFSAALAGGIGAGKGFGFGLLSVSRLK